MSEILGEKIQYRICIDCRMLKHSGIGTYIKNIVPRIIRLRENWKFDLIISDALRGSFDLDENCENYSFIISNASIFSISEQILFFKILKKQYDLLWIPNFNTPWYYKGNIIVTVHDVIQLSMPDVAGNLLKVRYAQWLIKRLNKLVSTVLTVSNFSKNELIRLGNFDEKKIYITYLGVDAFWSADITSSSPYYKPYILFVGNIKPNKNIRGLIKAFVAIKDKVDFDLVIVGKKDGFITEDKSFLSDYSKASDRIYFTGVISDENLREYYIYAEMFVFPSFYEGFGLPVLEAMSCRCPVACSNVASLPEVAGNAAIYFSPNNYKDISSKIMYLHNNKNVRENLKKRGLEQCKKFSWTVTAEKIIMKMDKLLKQVKT